MSRNNLEPKEASPKTHRRSSLLAIDSTFVGLKGTDSQKALITWVGLIISTYVAPGAVATVNGN